MRSAREITEGLNNYFVHVIVGSTSYLAVCVGKGNDTNGKSFREYVKPVGITPLFSLPRQKNDSN